MTLDSFLLHFAPALTTSIAIVLVGWWVNTTVRKKSQKGSIVISHLQERQKEIHQLVEEAVNAKEFTTCLKKLRGLSNEISHLSDLHEQLCKKDDKEREIMDELENVFINLKKNLTSGGVPVCEEERERARQIGNQLRLGSLKVMFGVCESAEKMY